MPLWEWSRQKANANGNFCASGVRKVEKAEPLYLDLAAGAQPSGGLLLAVPAAGARDAVADLRAAGVSDAAIIARSSSEERESWRRGRTRACREGHGLTTCHDRAPIRFFILERDWLTQIPWAHLPIITESVNPHRQNRSPLLCEISLFLAQLAVRFCSPQPAMQRSNNQQFG